MKTKLSIFLLLLFIPIMVYSQYIPDEFDLYIDDVIDSDEKIISTPLRAGSSKGFYEDFNSWIPDMSNNEPLKNSPIKTIEVSFHIFLDDDGGNCEYLNTTSGRNRLITVLNNVNQIYSGHPNGPSDPVYGIVELPDYDTRIRFSLGDNNERIYFYNNTELNKQGLFNTPFYNYILYNYPERTDKLNIYFTAGFYSARILEKDIIITNQGSGYTSPPTITFSHGNAKGKAIIENEKLVKIELTNDGVGSYNNFDPPAITISGGGGSGASAYVSTLSGGAGGYANRASSTLSVNHYVVMLQSHLSVNDTYIGGILAHELGHNLDLGHTYCGGGASAICWSGSCTISCTNPTPNKEYLSDIFGMCPNSTCPHIASWDFSPFDNDRPDGAIVTNNLMGGAYSFTYISPMQAGQIHRALALKSTRKYVKQETYSDIPLVITNDEIWDFDLKLYRDIIIAPGATLTMANAFIMPYNRTITVENGAALIIEGDIKLQDENKILVKPGGTIKIESTSMVNVNDNAFIWVEPSGYFCLENGARVMLNDENTSIILPYGYINGVNTSLISPGRCINNPETYPVEGDGAIKVFNNVLYIQNTTLNTNQIFRAMNIYVGKAVDPRLARQGDVIITNNAHIIFEALENVVLDKGFECEPGSTFEIR